MGGVESLEKEESNTEETHKPKGVKKGAENARTNTDFITDFMGSGLPFLCCPLTPTYLHRE